MEYLVAGSEDRILILDKGINLDIQGLEKKINMRIVERINEAQSDIRNPNGILWNREVSRRLRRKCSEPKTKYFITLCEKYGL
jgi:hypothetical protein